MAKQIVVISGKGGSGKTVISGALSAVIPHKVIVDADVDASNLYLILNPQNQENHEFSSGKKAVIDDKKCNQDGYCVQFCRFDAICLDKENTNTYYINQILCEGCGFCARICPAKAISMQPSLTGEWYHAQTQYGEMVYAKLGIAEENSGKLVSLVKREAVKLAEKNNCDWLLIDGPPGIGCPVIATLSGADIALVIIEASISGLHDAMRVIEVAQHFHLQVFAVINKYDLNLSTTEKIIAYCDENNIPILGKIKYNPTIVTSLVMGKNIMEISQPELHEVQETILAIWQNIKNYTLNTEK